MFVLTSFAGTAFSLDLERLTPTERHLAKTTLKALKLSIDPRKSNGSMNLLTFDELYTPLAPEQKNFLEGIRSADPKILGATAHTFDNASPDVLFVQLPDQGIHRSGSLATLPKQYLPKEVYEAYEEMMTAMHADIGKRLYVESGYRSHAYQLYLFLYYLRKHDYSLRETNRFVALPGHSEHGAPHRQAIDFINEEGINGEEHPEEFETLPEYEWLTRHAKRYGFFLSYPRDNPWGTSFEPWHWHFEKQNQNIKRKRQN
ncbi:MAG: M15 family metallopeptidase [Candidatus Omnitrophica bacterium]|nr:M15 family metallopeptidase [Candidatus Omnitrophota bacterium]